MEKIFRVSFLIFSFHLLASCTTLKKEESKIDCRNRVDDASVQREIQADLKDRFPNYKEVYPQVLGLPFTPKGFATTLFQLEPKRIEFTPLSTIILPTMSCVKNLAINLFS
jgi:hypothetical protein